MKLLLTVGHSILKSGACTSADGRPFGGVLEYSYNKEIAKDTAEYLRKAGHIADVLICPELQFYRSSEERNYKLPRANSGGYDLIAELHLNASKYHNARGSEVLYICEKGKRIAENIEKELSTVFPSRKIRYRNDLYMLTQTQPTAVLIESFYCDNSADCHLAAKTNVALLIAQGIHGEKILPPVQEELKGILYRVQLGAFSVKKNAELLQNRLKAQGFDAFITDVDLGTVLYRVQVGAFRRRANAEAMQKKLSTLGFSSFIAAA